MRRVFFLSLFLSFVLSFFLSLFIYLFFCLFIAKDVPVDSIDYPDVICRNGERVYFPCQKVVIKLRFTLLRVLNVIKPDVMSIASLVSITKIYAIKIEA